MKKTIKLFALLLTAASLFMSCNHAAQEDDSSKKEGLFNYKKETTVVMDKANFDPAALADGKWVYLGIEEFVDKGFYVEEIRFTKTSGAIKISKYTIYIETNKKGGFKNPSDAEVKNQQLSMNDNKGIFLNFKSNDVKDLKTNKENNKFYAYAEGFVKNTNTGKKDQGYMADFYLMKK